MKIDKKYIFFILLCILLLVLVIGKNPESVILSEGEKTVLSTQNPLLDKLTKWESKNNSTAVIKKNTVSGMKVGVTTVTGHSPIRTFQTKVTVLGFAQKEYRMAQGDTIKIKIIGTDAGINYHVKDEKVAIVNEKGELKALTPGKTTLLGEYMGHSFQTSIHTLGMKEIPTLTPGKKVSLKIESADEMEVIHYSSNNEDVAKIIRKDKGKTSILKAVSGGTAEITAVTEDGITMKQKIIVEELSEKEIYIKKGSKASLELKGGSAAVWTSKNPKIASIENGVVTGLKKGETKVIAKIGDNKLECKVHVFELKKAYLVSCGSAIPLPKELKEWNAGENIKIKDGILSPDKQGIFYIFAKVKKQEFKTKILSVDTSPITLNKGSGRRMFCPDKIKWTSDNPSIAKIENGTLKAVEKGETIIKGAIGKQTVSIPVTIISSDTQVSILDEKVELNGEKFTLDQARSAAVTDDDGNVRIFTVFKQNGGLFHSSTYDRFLTNQGCAACALTTVLRAYVPEYKDIMPYDTQEGIEKEVFGDEVWESNYNKSKKMPISLNGISEVLNAKGINSEYVRSFSDSVAKNDIINHLHTGNPVVITVGMKNRRTGKSDTRWSNSYHTVVLLGMKGTDTVYVGDSVNRSWNSGRIKEASLSDLIDYMFPCTEISTSRYFSGRKTSGGYIKVNAQ